jgi:hypothetical protein
MCCDLFEVCDLNFMRKSSVGSNRFHDFCELKNSNKD